MEDRRQPCPVNFAIFETRFKSFAIVPPFDISLLFGGDENRYLPSSGMVIAKTSSVSMNG